jgi:hypothetical protein
LDFLQLQGPRLAATGGLAAGFSFPSPFFMTGAEATA